MGAIFILATMMCMVCIRSRNHIYSLHRQVSISQVKALVKSHLIIGVLETESFVPGEKAQVRWQTFDGLERGFPGREQAQRVCALQLGTCTLSCLHESLPRSFCLCQLFRANAKICAYPKERENDAALYDHGHAVCHRLDLCIPPAFPLLLFIFMKTQRLAFRKEHWKK